MAPYRLAICEDDPVEGEHLMRMCDTLLSDREIPHTLSLFDRADALARELERDIELFDLLLLDIQMEGQSGAKVHRGQVARLFVP